MKRIACLLILLMALSLPAFSMDRFQAVEYFMSQGAQGDVAVDLAFALYIANSHQEDTHQFNIMVYEANRQVNHLGRFGKTWEQALDSVREILLIARKVIAREEARLNGVHVYE